MNSKLGNEWIRLAIEQACRYQLATAAAARNVEASCLPRSRDDGPLNPMEFHGKRRSDWPPRLRTDKHPV